MFIVKKRKKAGKYYYLIAETIYVNGKPKQKILKYLGSVKNILKIFKDRDKKRKKIISQFL